MTTEPSLSESELLALVQRGISEGQLPILVPPVISAGYGTGRELCRVCALVIPTDRAAYEVTDPFQPAILTFHFACYVVWQRECAQRLANNASTQAQSLLQVLGQVLEHGHATGRAVEANRRELPAVRGRATRVRH